MQQLFKKTNIWSKFIFRKSNFCLFLGLGPLWPANHPGHPSSNSIKEGIWGRVFPLRADIALKGGPSCT